MAWYYGEYSCGHKGRVDIVGPTKHRQWKADRHFEGLCEECWEAKKVSDREAANAEAAKKAAEMELPELQGSEKQVAWANTIRVQILEAIEGFKNKEGVTVTDAFHETVDHVITSKAKASWWIDNRHYVHDVKGFILMAHEEAKKEKREAADANGLVDIRTEAMVMPEKAITNATAEIRVQDDKIVVLFEKNDTFREVVRSLSYKWTGAAWERNLNELTGLAHDRAAELGNKLLNAGIPVVILDEEIRKAAIGGQYVPECNRWILKVKDENKLKIKWWEKNDRLYQVARKLPGSKWDKGVIVNISHYREIEEFAELYSFKFTQKAREAIEAEKERIAKVERVKPAHVEEQEQKDGLKEILNSSNEVLDDLKD